MKDRSSDVHPLTKNDILNMALKLADTSSWEAVRLYDIATALDISLNDIRCFFREKEEITDAWFDRADSTMLAEGENPECKVLPMNKRLQHLIMTWLGALENHKQVTRQMICGKLEPGHLHIQIPALLRISRTVQWLREAAGSHKTFVARILDETYLSAIFITTFIYWLIDDTDDHKILKKNLLCSLQFYAENK